MLKHRAFPFGTISLTLIALLVIVLGVLDDHADTSNWILQETITTTGSTSTVVVPVPIPGFPFASILVGMLLGVVIVVILQRRKG